MDAAREELDIDTKVVDIRQFKPARAYDVVVIDRTLHMLETEDRAPVLRLLLRHIRKNGAVLIADVQSNISAFQTVFDESNDTWTPILRKRGFLFLRRGR